MIVDGEFTRGLLNYFVNLITSVYVCNPICGRLLREASASGHDTVVDSV